MDFVLLTGYIVSCNSNNRSDCRLEVLCPNSEFSNGPTKTLRILVQIQSNLSPIHLSSLCVCVCMCVC